MSTLNVMIPSAAGADDFVKKASGLPVDINLSAGSRVVDAKSILGILYLGVGKILQLTAASEELPYMNNTFSDYLV